MFVQALAAYADEYLSEELSQEAWEEKPVPVLIEIGADGTFLRTVERLRHETRGTKMVTLPQPLQVPRSPVNRNSGLHPLLAADDIKYVLGPGPWTNTGDEQNASERHEAFAALIGAAARSTLDPALESCALFYSRPDEVQAARNALKDSKAGALVALSVDGPLVSRPAVKSFWNEHYRQEFQERIHAGGIGECLVSGVLGPISPTHEKIKGMSSLGGQPSGVSLMSFDKSAFRSYGWEQNANSPVSPGRAMAYVMALNDLLRNDKGHRRDVAGVGFVYWTKKRSDFDLNTFFEQAGPEQVSALLRFDPLADPDPNMFYMAGVSGNGARLLVRYWIAETLATVKTNLKEWYQGLAVIGRDGEPAAPPRRWQLLLAIDRMGEPKPNLVLALMRRAIEGSARPLGYGVLNALLGRLRHAPEKKPAGPEKQLERFAPARMGLLRLCLNDIAKGEMYMTESLDPQQNHPAYVCGRLLAEYENLQDTAYFAADEAKVNMTVADRYYSLASTSPAIAFPKIVGLGKNHFRKLRNNPRYTGLAGKIDRQIAELCEKVGTKFPSTLSLDGQGRFALGYYHQKAERSRQIAENRDRKTAAAIATEEQE